MTLTKALVHPIEKALRAGSKIRFAAVFQWSRDLGSYIGSSKRTRRGLNLIITMILIHS